MKLNTTQKNKLAIIAREMIAEAEKTGRAQHQLPRGLMLELIINGEDRILSLTRYASKPSDLEFDICRDAFGVPGWVSPRDADLFFSRGYGIIRLHWNETRRAKIRKLAQGHLAPGWSLHRWTSLIQQHGIEDFNRIDDDLLDELLATIYDEEKETEASC